MASTFSPSLRIELIGDGDQSGIWGQTTNNNLGALIEQAIAGVVTITMVDANYTMTNFNGVTDEARNQVIVLTGTNTAQRNLIAPLVEKTYMVKNSTTGGFAVQIIGSSGTGVIVPNGATLAVYCDGTNFFPLNTGAGGNFFVSGNLSVTGTTTLTGALAGSTAAFSGAISSVSPAFTGIPTAPTAAGGTNTTQIATTAFVQSATGGLGTMSTQNANNVNITGGSITGSYGLTAANATNVTGTIASGVTATTQAPGTNNTTVATTAFVLTNAPTSPIPAGSVMLFYQAAAPSGWTQVTTQNNKALRVVSGSGGVAGGTTAFSSVFQNQTVSTSVSVSVSGTTGATTLSTGQIPSHTHTVTAVGSGGLQPSASCGSMAGGASSLTTDATGGGGSHDHSFSGSGSGSGTSSAVTLNVQYIDIILCSKN
jgi:hypothetical protein